MILIGLFYIVMVYAGTMGYGIDKMAVGYVDEYAPFDTISQQYGGVMRVLIDLVGTIGFFSAALAIVMVAHVSSSPSAVMECCQAGSRGHIRCVRHPELPLLCSVDSGWLLGFHWV